ncbi:MAG: hypothetical protein P4M08_12160 [Oligoflexia bacterium]|nr:hypothetical protein [Oligoflexia bacterium]
MKTLSEFFGKNLRALEEQLPKISQEATQSAEEALKAEGKSEEEIKAALPEATQKAVLAKLTELTKYEGDKAVWLKNALSLVHGKRGNLKRVIVMEAAEGEKSTQNTQLVDGKYFAIEFYPDPSRAAAPRPSKDDQSGGKRRGRRDRDKKGGRGAPSGERGPGRGTGRENRPPRPRNEPLAAGTGKTSSLIILSGQKKAPEPKTETPSENTTPNS